ncbi:hypothetical protein PHYBLDRAFT_152039 [Phycomyces blakesleeanus NRRL 1555(-)]|uniref:Uncharacterized protein n=1 Tax=Phycomyces blakesleeanus (strain ATCC 8743b / DSM 1359 / FGSC 10004 / NBRC 33097 / NRRL 1555) TaxID=763407 RepID=A0A167JVG0_PHYB8|nr:hypothetical protein PHYBLDRAFT_152039 [Phycomyces blakesleeanus NRRL 1555(-)]OAD66769.1 hypothetical protein PHYBLDRAFT_152039 [Phycomyces blakesleeanus NRRL 1555(-)]|eukprot:XP_018284809.1 hypothetical protein PHYBLDRAFT_152039 [Phycomyces blakesleeanus NRRL 1555(-)]
MYTPDGGRTRNPQIRSLKRYPITPRGLTCCHMCYKQIRHLAMLWCPVLEGLLGVSQFLMMDTRWWVPSKVWSGGTGVVSPDFLGNLVSDTPYT